MIELTDIRLEQMPEQLKARLASTQIEVSTAASQLARLRHEAIPKSHRVYTGRIGRKRAWRGMKVILPEGNLGELLVARRGAAFVTWADPFAVNAVRHAALWAAELKRFKLPAAVMLGARKRGIKERSSIKKARAARRNGLRPVRAGSRPRGRPARATAPKISLGSIGG